eukprot:TRINITY_DN464_c0_g1_i1.p2 TRINITY_DN464_c0_g1~~TRINITY_DN464_c0_g1_i1.p2  ORF type:complete len:346 (-),score=104.56 TRINITY_DN464_c0_g1_i1:362-1399(-)
MGCGGSEENDTPEDVVVDVHDDDDQEEAQNPRAHLIPVQLFIEQAGGDGYSKQICWCEPEMLWAGLLEHGIQSRNSEEDCWEDFEVAVAGAGSPLNMITINHTIGRFAANFKSADFGGFVYKTVCAYLYPKGDGKDKGIADEAVKFASELPGNVKDAQELPDVDLEKRLGQLQVCVYAAVPVDPNDEAFTKDVTSEHCVERESTTVYCVKMWATRKVVVGAFVDAGNAALSKFVNVKFGCGEAVTSYALGHPGGEDHPLLDFEVSDEIEDLDFFEEAQDRLHFVIYNHAEDGKASCDVKNFWGNRSMIEEYRDKKQDLAKALVKAEHNVTFDAPDWPALIEAHQP